MTHQESDQFDRIAAAAIRAVRNVNSKSDEVYREGLQSVVMSLGWEEDRMVVPPVDKGVTS